MATSAQLERFWLLTGLKLNNEASEEEVRELDQLMSDHPELEEMSNSASLFFHFKASSLPLPDPDQSFARHKQRLGKPERRRGMKKVFRFAIPGSIAASLIVLFIIHNRNGEKTKSPLSKVVTSTYGTKSRVELPDGTQVWLNADSKLTYGEGFGVSQREIQLSGEAFFDVAKDAAHPFILHTGQVSITVLGTAFNVRAYQGEQISEATLLRGSIEVSLNTDHSHKILLKPNEKLVIRSAGATVPVKDAVSADSTRGAIFQLARLNPTTNEGAGLEHIWKKNALVFRGEPLENVATRIEHWFGVKVVIADEGLKTKTFSCDFKEESLSQVMEALRLTGGFDYKIKNDSVLIKNKY